MSRVLDSKSTKTITIALAGNANVGKSAIFNQLTGLVQETGNWSGKTVGLKVGKLQHHGFDIRIVDLPGVYSFTSYSPDEVIARNFILQDKPDVIIDVLDAVNMERNLYFTLQLKELGIPCVIAINYADIAKKKHIHLDLAMLSQLLGYPVINTIAIKGIGVHELVDAALDLISKKPEDNPSILYGPEIEGRLTLLTQSLEKSGIQIPIRWTALKLLEKDPDIQATIGHNVEIITLADKLAAELQTIHGEDSPTVIASERYSEAAQIARQISQLSEPRKKAGGFFDNLTLHPVLGYVTFVITMAAILVFVSIFGSWATTLITRLFESFNPHFTSALGLIFWNGSIVGLYAALSVALGFILPFILFWPGWPKADICPASPLCWTVRRIPWDCMVRPAFP